MMEIIVWGNTMQRSHVRSFIVIGMLFLIVGTSAVIIGGTARASAPVDLDNHIDPSISKARFVRAAPVSQSLSISVGLQMRNTGEFNDLLRAIYDPASSLYHHYLTPEQFTQEFAPTDDQIQQVKAYLQNQGMTVKGVASDKLLLDVNATVAQAQQAFNVQINTYKSGSNTFYANNTPIQVPGTIRPLVTAVSGLDSSVKLRHNYQSAKVAAKASPLGYTPKNVANAYDITPLQRAGFLGDKQTIALFEMDGYLPSDVMAYEQFFNLTSLLTGHGFTAGANLTNVLVDGYSGIAGQNALEVSTDIEMVASIAPHANMLVYEGPNTVPSMNDIYAKIVNDNKAQIVSTSWGLCEAYSGNAELQLLDNIFKQGAAQGMSFFAASGDAGAYGCGDTNLGVGSPASDPYVTSVGGTSLQLNANSTIKSESVWSDPTATFYSGGSNYLNGIGSGGGMSSFFAQPSWQKGPGVQNSYSNGNREVPDVSANADGNDGFAIFCTILDANGDPIGWNDIGGTSAATPLWAASAILINQYIQAEGKKPLGQINPVLYGLFNGPQTYPAFHDITTGTNLYYPATAGYDMASGLGSPDVYNIARDL